MSDPKQLDSELREYLELEPNLRREERLQYLRTIVNKHFELNKLTHMINKGDLFEIISGAKSAFTGFRLPLSITRRPVEPYELTNVAMIESVVSYLNKNNLMKKLVKLDYTE